MHIERPLGSLSLDSGVCFSMSLPGQIMDTADAGQINLDLQLRYTGCDGGEYLAVTRKQLAVSSERHDVEQNMDPEVVAVAAIQRAARLAQCGSYRDARSDLISTQRLLQRGMGSVPVQKAYLPFIFQAEKLDQFIREQ